MELKRAKDIADRVDGKKIDIIRALRDAYAEGAESNETLVELKAELEAVRRTHQGLLNQFSELNREKESVENALLAMARVFN